MIKSSRKILGMLLVLLAVLITTNSTVGISFPDIFSLYQSTGEPLIASCCL